MTLAHDAAGSGPPVLLLHSTVCDRRMWDPQLPALTDAGYRTVRCDLRGYGDSPVPQASYSDAEDVVELLDTLGIERTAVVAASGGGRVALEVAARWPSRVSALALLCTAMAGHEPGPALRAFGEREDTLLEAGDVGAATELNVDTWLTPDATEATREAVRAMQRNAFVAQLAGPDVAPIQAETDLSAITAPALLVSGARDLVDFRQVAARLAELLPDARRIELPWAGHLPSIERPEELNAILIDFLTIDS
ncbi:alpha/beta fold hydrolase [Micromonospora sp. CPCC 206061]|uniref:alpha/beta fold hydrolase n=1 Tax=Micromonospora sp. CPCC 206061 TaxID=3122410 RepID=UPI002FF14B04